MEEMMFCIPQGLIFEDFVKNLMNILSWDSSILDFRYYENLSHILNASLRHVCQCNKLKFELLLSFLQCFQKNYASEF